MAKEATLIRLTPDAKKMLEKLAASQGLNLTSYVETLIRREAKREKIEVGDD